MYTKVDLKQGLFDVCEVLISQVKKNCGDKETITALSAAVRALAAALDSADYDDMGLRDMGNRS